MYDVSVLGENVLFQLVKTRVRTLIWQPQQLSNCWPSSFVEWPRRMRWEWLPGESEREITEKQRLQEREWEKRRRSERWGTRKRGRSGRPADVKVPPITSCFSSTPALCLYLFHPFFQSHWHSSLGASLHCDVPFRSAITAEMRQPGGPREWARKFAVPVRVKIEAQMHTYAVGDTSEHSDTQQRPLSQGSSQGIMRAFCRNGAGTVPTDKTDAEKKSISFCLHLSSYSPPPL